MIISPCVYKLLLLYYPWTEHFNVFSVLSGPFPCLGSHGGNSGRTRYTRRTFDSIQCDDYHSDLSSCLCTYDICLYFSKYWWCGKYSSTRHLNWMQFSSWKTSHTLKLHGIIWTGPGTLVFIAKITILCWVKFYNYSKPVVVAASVVLVLVCIVFVWFTVHFYRSLVQHKYERSFQGEIFFNRLQTNCTQIQGQYQAHQQAVHVLIMGFEIICITKPSVLHFLLDAPYSYCTSQNLTCNPPFLLLLCYL